MTHQYDPELAQLAPFLPKLGLEDVPAARAAMPAATPMAKTQSQIAQKRTIRIVVSIASRSTFGVSVRFVVQAHRDDIFRRNVDNSV